MDFIRKHYEKVLLGVVLLGLVVALGFLPFKIATEKQRLDEMSGNIIHTKIKPLTNLDLSLPELALKRSTIPAYYDFASTNKLFNSMPWQQTADKRLIRSDKTGPTAVIVTNITPLYLKVGLDSVTLSSDGAPVYLFGVEKQSAPTKAAQGKKQAFAKVGEKNPTFFFKQVNGPAANPTNVVIELNDSGETAIVPNDKDKPWKRIDGYMADLRYELKKQTFGNMRVGASLDINGEKYNIIAISKNEVILSAASNQKKWTIKLSNPV